MTLLILGLILFLGVHSVRIFADPWRSAQIARIGAAARMNGLNYNQFMFGLKNAGVEMDRKILADLAVKDPAGFASLTTQAKGAIGGAA